MSISGAPAGSRRVSGGLWTPILFLAASWRVLEDDSQGSVGFPADFGRGSRRVPCSSYRIAAGSRQGFSGPSGVCFSVPVGFVLVVAFVAPAGSQRVFYGDPQWALDNCPVSLESYFGGSSVKPRPPKTLHAISLK